MDQAEVTVQRIAAVQQGVSDYGWSASTIERLAKELNISTRTVRRCWDRAVKLTRRAFDPSNVEKMRVRQVMRLETNIANAARTGDYSAAMKGEQVYAQLVGTVAPTNVNVTHNVGVSPALSVKLSGLSVTELTAIAQRRAPDAEPEVVEGELVDAPSDKG